MKQKGGIKKGREEERREIDTLAKRERNRDRRTDRKRQRKRIGDGEKRQPETKTDRR